MINVTFSSMLMFVATIPELLAFTIAFVTYLKKKYLHYIYLFGTWFFMWISNLLLAIGYLTLNLEVYRIGIIFSIPITLSIMFLVDSISRDSVSHIKLTLITIVSTLAFIFSFDSNVIRLNTSRIGEVGPSITGKLNIAISSLFLISAILWFYYFIVIYIKAPKNLKKIARLNLIGSIIGGPVAALTYATGIVWFLPGTDYFCISIGALISTYSFVKEPKLGYVLPFKVSRLLIIDINSGLPIFTYTWDSKGLIDSYLFSGAIHGISLILSESLHKGKVKEIRLEEATLILKVPDNDLPVVFVLITTKTSAILNQSLEQFSENLSKRIKKEQLDELTTTNILDLNEYITSAFPYVVSYKE